MSQAERRPPIVDKADRQQEGAEKSSNTSCTRSKSAMEVHPGLFNPSAGGEGGSGGALTGSSSHHTNNQGRLGLLSTDELATLCSYLPVVSVLALARSSKSLYAWVESLPFWREALEMLWPDLFYLLRNQPPTTAEACCSRSRMSGRTWRACFLDKAETEVNWRRGRPVKIVQQSLLGDEDGRATTQAVQSLHLYRPQHIEGGREVLLTGMGGEASICLFQGEHVSTVARIRAHDQAKINTIRGTRDFICTTGMDHKVKLFDWVDGQERRVLQNHTSSVWGLDVDESNPSVLVSSGYCVASLTDLRMWQPPVTLRAHGTWIRSLQVDLARHLLVTGSCDATCKSWDLRMGRQVCKYQHPDHFEEVRSVQFQGDRLVTGCYDGMVREYELGTGRLKRVLADHHKLAVECAHFYGDRCVSVDWAGLLNFAALSGGDSGVERAMYGSGSPQANGMGRYRLSPYNMADGSLGYRSLGTREPVPTSLETTMSSAVCCMQAGDDRLVMGRKDGRLVQLIFRDCA